MSSACEAQRPSDERLGAGDDEIMPLRAANGGKQWPSLGYEPHNAGLPRPAWSLADGPACATLSRRLGA